MVEAEFRFFSNLMGTATIELPFPNVEVIKSGPNLLYDQKYKLIIPIIEQEMYAAIKIMPYDKSPGIYGFPTKFFLKNWSIIKQDIIDVIKEYFESRKLLRSFSCTSVTLIPKVTNPN